MPVCDLECGGGLAHEFIGPVRIVVVDDEDYYLKLFKMALLMFVFILMGIQLAVPAIYFLDFTVQYYNILHVLLGTLLCQCMVPIGILLHNPLVLSTAPMRPADRLKEHVKVQAISCFLLFCTSIVASYIDTTRATNIRHKSLGGFMVFICIMNTTLGALIRYWDWDAFGIKWKPYFVIGHKLLGCLTVILCSITYTTGIRTWQFIEHLPLRVQDNFINIISSMAFVYTVIIIYFPLMKLYEEQDFSKLARSPFK